MPIPRLTLSLALILLVTSLLVWLQLAPESPAAPGAAATSAEVGTIQGVIRHQLKVRFDPARGELSVRDQITLPGAIERFQLADGLSVTRSDPPLTRDQSGYRIGGDTTLLVIEYHGRPFGTGEISGDGLFLHAGAPWYPLFEGDELLAFEMEVALPPGWSAVSQGELLAESDGAMRWRESAPQQGIYLIADRFQRYQRDTPQAEAQLFLRRPDSGLAERYLQATAHYLDLYSALIGDYPYAKFALVENRHQTGYGMPSFTLLGSRVIRLPFILRSSYPHEILHSWWGNSVYVDYASGNWSEGLTTYLADHLLEELRGRGARYRREALQRYADYVRTAEEFPLSAFRARHGEASQAIGYSKAMMLFHMLRRRLGDERFVAGIRRLYSEQRFRRTSYSELRERFEQISGDDLKPFFDQWVERVGAPTLEIADLLIEPIDAASAPLYRLHGALRQQGEPYQLDVALAIQLENEAEARRVNLTIDSTRHPFQLDLPARPVALQVDPYFDLMRRLDREETPPSLSQLLGAEQIHFLLPNKASHEEQAAYRRFSDHFSNRASVSDDRTPLPDHGAVWLLGWENRAQSQLLARLPQQRFAQEGTDIRLEGRTWSREGQTLLMVARLEDGRAIAWLATDQLEQLSQVARKLRYYGKYSYLLFAGAQIENQMRGQWPLERSPLRVTLQPGATVRLPAESALLDSIAH